MKKVLALMLVMVLVLSLAACGEDIAPKGKYWQGSGSVLSWEFNGNELTQTIYNLDDTVHSVTTEIFSMDGNKIYRDLNIWLIAL